VIQLTHIVGTMALLRLCVTGGRRPKTLAFTSSTSTCMGPGQTLPVPELPIGEDTSVVLPTGYAQSKYVGTFYCSETR
jgi:nucleoside-diphosphate-sugar epimerase